MPALGVPESELVPSGLPAVGAVRWGTHLCQVYRTAEDLRDALVPYFRAGLQHNERCIWVTCAPFEAAAARAALAAAVPDLAEREKIGQIDIFDYADWYAKSGAVDGDGVLRNWLDEEAHARSRGFEGLRITGNTYWLQRREWGDFLEYEAKVHEAFADRHILALCSYSVERCTVEDILDILPSHEFALLRRDGKWGLVYSATELVELVRPATQPAKQHVAQFYSTGRYPADGIATFLAEGVTAGARAVGIVTAPHWRAIASALRAREIDPGAVRILDAEELLDRYGRGGDLDLASLRAAAAELVAGLTSGGHRVHLFGEMVDVLCLRGQQRRAVELETLWNEVLDDHQLVSLYCTYDLASFRGHGAIDEYRSVCGTHGDIRIDAAPEDQDFVASALSAEVQQRLEVDAERARERQIARSAADRLARLQRVTWALSEVRTVDQIARVLERDVCSAVGATGALAVATTADQTIETIPPDGSDTGAARCSARILDTAVRPAVDAYRGTGVWLSGRQELRARYPEAADHLDALVALPLRIAGRKLGALALGFAGAPSFGAGKRALIEDIAYQVALTLERSRLYEEADEQRARAERANASKDDFLAMLGHELRNPLGAIKNAAEFLKLLDKSDKARRVQSVLERQTAHMAKLIDGLLDVTRVVRGKIALEVETVDVANVLQETIKGRLAQIDQRELELKVSGAERGLHVRGDRVRLTQIFDNLLANAIKFTPQGGTVSIEARSDAGEAAIVVRDTGTGIDPAILPAIFEPFQQAAQELARTSGGLGLGLSVVKGLVELHGGTVSADSDGPGRGAEFAVRIPLCEARAERPRTPATAATPGARVLLIEDNRDFVELFRDVLEASGHTARIAYDGETGLEAARGLELDVVFCDLGLPGELTGFDVARALCRDEGCADVLLVALTGYGRPEDVARAEEAGFDVHLTKPIDMDAVVELIAAARSEPRQAAAAPSPRSRAAPVSRG